MKKIVIALTILFFLTGCQSTKDTKETSQTRQEEKQEEQGKTEQETDNTKQETDNTKQETDNTVTSGKQEKKEENSKTKETKQQEASSSTPPSAPNENTPPISTPTPIPPVETKEYVTISIDCRTVLNNMDTFKEQYKSFVPSNGIILADTKVVYASGDTVLSLLKKVTKENGIRIINQAGYISNIANINQMGMQSGQGGWMYKVNGTLGDVGAGTYKLSSGDIVQWRYTCYPGDI